MEQIRQMNLPKLDIELAQEINAELDRSRAKFPGNQNMTVALMEEVGELARAQLESLPISAVRAEAIQVIAAALRILFEGDASIPRVETVKDKPS